MKVKEICTRVINKLKFVIFDCFDGTLIRYFQNTSDFEIELRGKTPLTLPEIIENIWQNVDGNATARLGCCDAAGLID